MPAKKRRPEPSWQVVLEEMRSQNRATIEAVEASRVVLEQRIERIGQESRSRDATLELAIRELRLDLQQLRGNVRGLVTKVEALARIEERVAALEKRLA